MKHIEYYVDHAYLRSEGPSDTMCYLLAALFSDDPQIRENAKQAALNSITNAVENFPDDFTPQAREFVQATRSGGLAWRLLRNK